jgi:hypothetical protein
MYFSNNVVGGRTGGSEGASTADDSGRDREWPLTSVLEVDAALALQIQAKAHSGVHCVHVLCFENLYV